MRARHRQGYGLRLRRRVPRALRRQQGETAEAEHTETGEVVCSDKDVDENVAAAEYTETEEVGCYDSDVDENVSSGMGGR